MGTKIEFFAIYLGLYSSAFVFTVIFPYASEMVMGFGTTSDKNGTGYWVGLLATSLMVGRTISSPIWGLLIDKWGRKPVTQIGLFMMILLSISFGLSPSLFWALFFRFLLGCFSPLMISSRTILSEICSKEEISSAMAWYNLSWNIGSISGNLIGGVLSNPESKGITNNELFTNYPYLLPNLFPAVICLIAFILGQKYLRETMKNKNETFLTDKQRTIKEILLDKKIFPALTTCLIMSFSSTCFQELITLYSWAKTESGGLELSTNEIGYLLGGINLVLLFFQRQFYMTFYKKLGNIKLSQYSLITWTVIISSLPITSTIENQYFKYSFLFLVCLLWYLADFVLFTSIFVILNNSVPSNELARLNGSIISLNCLGRMLAPTTIGTTFALSVNSGLTFPLNYAFSFYLIASVLIVGVFCSFKLGSEETSEDKNEIALTEIEE